MRGTVIPFVILAIGPISSSAWIQVMSRSLRTSYKLLSGDFLENDLVAVQRSNADSPRLCVVRPGNDVLPLCQHEDDVETDLFIDPRCYENKSWEEVSDEDVKGRYGEGWYGQRPVPSLGGGPGYGAEAQEVWSIDEEMLSRLGEDRVELPILDMGIAHGEKARSGAF